MPYTSPSPYETGTVTLEAGNVTVIGNLTGWFVNGVNGGMFCRDGMAVPIRSVEDDTHLTLAYGWPGANAAGVSYVISRETALAADALFANNTFVKVLRDLAISSVHPDGSGTLAERNALSPVPAVGYIWLRIEVGQPLELYKKEISGWSGPYGLTGPQGLQGPAATIAVGDVTTVAPGTPADVTNVGTSGAAVFNFDIPQGDSSTIDIGTVTTVGAGQPATVTDVGVPGAAIFDFEIPQGIPGVGSGGYGLPLGGILGQLLRKASATDGDVGWYTPGYADKATAAPLLNLDAVTVSGINYADSTTSNRPTGAGNWLVETIFHEINGVLVQIAYDRGTGARAFTRRRDGTNWSQWYPLGTPAGGAAGQVLRKIDTNDGNSEWAGYAVPAGGAINTVLRKTSAADGALGFATLATILGYTPVQQGTGVGQLGNDLKVGHSSVGPRATVDTVDFGRLWNDKEAGYTPAQTGVSIVKLPTGGMIVEGSFAGTPNGAGDIAGIFGVTFVGAARVIACNGDATSTPSVIVSVYNQLTDAFLARVHNHDGTPCTIAVRINYVALGRWK